MPIHIDVLAGMDERAAEDVSRMLERRFAEAGAESGRAFSRSAGQALGGLSDEAQGAFDRIVNKANIAGAAIGASLIGGITAASAALVEIGEKFESIGRGIETTTAASGQALDDLKNHADALVGSLDVAVGNVGTIMGTIASQMNMGAGPALDALTGHVAELADRFKGLDTNALIGGLVQMGVAGAQADQTIASLVGSAREFGGVLPQIASGIGEYGNYFKELGLDAEQAGHMIGELAKAHIPLTTAMGGLQAAQKANVEVAKNTGQPVQEFSAFVERAAKTMEDANQSGNTALRDQIALLVFGQRKWIDAQVAAHEYLETLRAGPAAFKGSIEEEDKFIKATQNLHNEFTKLKNNIALALEPVAHEWVDLLVNKLHEFGDWAKAHQDELKELFHGAAEAAGTVITVLEKITEVLGSHPGLIQAVADAFLVWKGITVISAVATGLGSILTLLGGIEAAAIGAGGALGRVGAGGAAAGAGAAAGGAAEFAGLPALLNPATLGVAGGLALTGGTIWAAKAWADAHPESRAEMDARSGVPMGPMPGGQTVIPGMGITLPGTTGFGPGTVTPAPGDIGGMMGVPTVAPPPPPSTPGGNEVSGPGNIHAGIGGDLTPDMFEPAKKDKKGPKGPRLPEAPEIPYGPEFGAGPRAGESAAEYSAEGRLLEARHKVEEDRARVEQLEHTNTATAEDIQKARNKLAEDERSSLDAQIALGKARESALKKETDATAEFGAKIDKDFGISKGLPGIAENLTKFLANLVAAPIFGALQGAKNAIGGDTHGAAGLAGMIGLATGMGGSGGGGLGGGGLGGFGGGFGGAAAAALAAGLGGAPVGALGGSAGALAASGLPGGAPGGSGPDGLLGRIAAVGGGLNLSTIPIAAQKYANDCIDASARIILSHAGINMDEDQLEKVIAPGGTIQSQAAGMNQLDPAGGFQAMQGSGGNPAAMFAAIKASIDRGSGSILNVAPGSSIAGRPFSEGHFIAATGYNPDGTINLSDTARGTHYTVSAADAFQATVGRGIVAGTGSGPPAGGAGGSAGANGPAPLAPPPPPPARPLPALPGLPGAPTPGSGSGDYSWLPQYHAEGGPAIPFVPHGTDTVPAMLTPNEEVLSTKDVAALGGHEGVNNLRAGLNASADTEKAPPAPKPPPPPSPPSGPMIPGGTLMPNIPQPPGGAQPGPSMIGTIAAPSGHGQGFQVTGGGLVGVLESLPSTAVNSAISAAASGAAAAASGGQVQSPSYYADGGGVDPAGGGGGSSGGGASAMGGGAPGGLATAAINIGMQELNAGISSAGQAVGAVVGGLQQTFGPEQFAQSKLGQGSWVSKLVGGIMGAQPQLPNTAGPKQTPGLTAEQLAEQGGGPPGGGAGGAPGGGDVHMLHIDEYHDHGNESSGQTLSMLANQQQSMYNPAALTGAR